MLKMNCYTLNLYTVYTHQSHNIKEMTTHPFLLEPLPYPFVNWMAGSSIRKDAELSV